MRTIQLTLGSLAAAAATSALIGLGAASPAVSVTPDAAPATTTTEHEKGNVIECTGRVHGKDVYASVYENNLYANVIQVVIGEKGNSREVADGFLTDGVVRGSVKVAGARAVVKGTAHRVGKKKPVHEEMDDAGQHITIDGFHRRLANDLSITHRKKTEPLTCDNAFYYDLTVTKEDITD
ncbi:MAG: hypothetical protein ACXWXO_20440 [Nocardioides sp.]